jgi:hypothetical protein
MLNAAEAAVSLSRRRRDGRMIGMVEPPRMPKDQGYAAASIAASENVLKT